MTLNAFKWRLAGAFAALYLIWGSTYLAIRFALETLPPFTMSGARFGVAGMMLYALRLGASARSRRAGPQALASRSFDRGFAAVPRQRWCGQGRTIVVVWNDCAFDCYRVTLSRVARG